MVVAAGGGCRMTAEGLLAKPLQRPGGCLPCFLISVLGTGVVVFRNALRHPGAWFAYWHAAIRVPLLLCLLC